MERGEAAMNEAILREAGIDYEGALQRFVGKRPIYERYLAQFLEDAHAADARAALAAGDLPEVQEQLHALKGLSGTLGLSSLQSLCAEAVDRLREGEPAGMEGRIDAIDAERERLCGAIRSAREG